MEFLPICRQDMLDRGIAQFDFVYVIGDAYTDHPSFGHAIIKTDKVQEPIAEDVPKYEEFYQLYTEIYPALKGEFKKLASL